MDALFQRHYGEHNVVPPLPTLPAGVHVFDQGPDHAHAPSLGPALVGFGSLFLAFAPGLTITNGQPLLLVGVFILHHIAPHTAAHEIVLLFPAPPPPPDTYLKDIRARGVLRVGIDPTYAPFDTMQGNTVSGYDAQLASEIASALGEKKVNIVALSARGAKRARALGLLD